MRKYSSMPNAVSYPALRRLIALFIIIGGSAFCSLPASAQLYRDSSASIDKRVDDLVKRMTLEEKVRQMQNDAPAIPRLGVPAYEYWSEALHGVARAGEATVFPQAIGMAATWDADLFHAEGRTIGVEGRARYNQAQREGNTGRYYGLTFWSPNINIFRDPRWGRGQETLGEDPYLTGALGTEFIRGVQGDDPRYLQAIATPKHYAVHSGPEPLRHGFDVDPSKRDLFETYLPAFREAIVNGKANSIMCSYNAVDGKPACANPLLLGDILRRDWGFGGFVTSDCGAIEDITKGHHFTKSNAEGDALAVKAGTDTTCGNEYVELVESVRAGLISEPEIDVSVKRLFTARMRLGMFDPMESVPFSRIPIGENHSQPHQQLSLRAARESIVLLKNDGILPLSEAVRHVAVIGPGATSLIALEGNYKGTPTRPILPLDGLESAFGANLISYAQGAPYVEEAAIPVPRTAFAEGLHAEFFNGTGFQGDPVATRIDRQIDFDWNAVAPAPGITPNQFSVRWTGTLTVPAPGDYRFQIDDRRCDPSDDKETYTVRIEGSAEFHTTSSCVDFGQPRKALALHFADTRPRSFVLEYSHESPRFSAGVTFSWQAPTQALLNQAVQVASAADVIVAFVGLTPWLEGEEMPLHVPGFNGGDRTEIALPASQTKLLSALRATGKPLIIVLESGSAISLGDNAQPANAILEAWYSGEFGGQAIAEILKGTANPSGRLPITFYSSVSQLPDFSDYSMKGRTYRYFGGTPAYPFGFGLSYTKFSYSKLHISSEVVKAGDDQDVSVSVTNSGAKAGDEIVQLYLSINGAQGAPIRSLKGFRRTSLSPGEQSTIKFRLTSRDLALAGDDGTLRVTPAIYELWVGGGQPGTGASGVAGAFQVIGIRELAR
jgi:beta-glucosidase